MMMMMMMMMVGKLAGVIIYVATVLSLSQEGERGQDRSTAFWRKFEGYQMKG